MSGPISDTLGARLVVKATDMKGWLKNPIENKRGPNNREQFARLTLKWEPQDNLSFRLVSSVDRLKNNFTATLLRLCGGPGNTALPHPTYGPDPQPCGGFRWTSRTLSPLGQNQGQDFNSYAFTLESIYDASWGTITSVTGLNKADSKLGIVSNGTYNNGVYAYQAVRNKAFSEDIRIQTKFEGRVNLIAGAYYQTSDFFTENRARVLADAAQGTVSGQPVYTWKKKSFQDGESFSAFGEVGIDIVQDLRVDAGVRYTHETKKSEMFNYEVAPNLGYLLAPHYNADQTFSNWSPAVTLTWHPNDESTIFGAYKTGFKAGGFAHGQTIFYGAAAAPLPGSSLLFGSEKAKGFEVGYKALLFDRAVRVELVGYSYLYSDLQIQSYNPATNSYTVLNAAAARTKGLEFSSAWRIAPGISLSGTLNYNKARFKNFLGACNGLQTAGVFPCDVRRGTTFGQDLSGTPTPIAPEWSGRVDFEVVRPIGEFEITVGGGVQFSSSYHLDADNRADNVQKAYQRYDARIAIAPQNDNWELALIGQNLTNEYISIYGTQRSGSPRELTGGVDRARQVELRATMRF